MKKWYWLNKFLILHAIVYCSLSLIGQSWDTLSIQLNDIYGGVYAFYPDTNKLYIAGGFTGAGETKLGSIGSWNGNIWDSLAGGIDNVGTIYCMNYFNGSLFIGGNFFNADNMPNTSKIAMWNGTQWLEVSGGITGSVAEVKALEVYNNKLYVGGNFGFVNGDNIRYLVEWDGTGWNDLGGANNIIQCLDVFENQLYIGGRQTELNGVPVNYLGKYDGNIFSNAWPSFTGNYIIVNTTDTIKLRYFTGSSSGGGLHYFQNGIWHSISMGNTGDNIPGGRALKMYHGELYSGGGGIGYNYEGDSLRNIARWDGCKWKPVGGGIGGTVYGMEVWKDTLYVGGSFRTLANGDSAIHVAKWYIPDDGIDQEELAGGFSFSMDDTLWYSGTNLVVSITDQSSSWTEQWAWDLNGVSDSIPNPELLIDTTGNFSITQIVNYGHCADTLHKTIRVFPTPDCDTVLAQFTLADTLYLSDSLYLSAPTNVWNWQWNISGTTISTASNFKHIFDSTGTYSIQLKVSVDTLCYDSTTKTLVVIDTLTGIADIHIHSNKNSNFDFDLFPNPSEGIVTIGLKPTKANYKLTVLTIKGEVVMEQMLSINQFQFSTSNWKSGNYWVKIENELGGVVTKQLVVR